jgi:acyl dehydratase
MLHDGLGNPLKIGDEVAAIFEVTSIHPTRGTEGFVGLRLVDSQATGAERPWVSFAAHLVAKLPT